MKLFFAGAESRSFTDLLARAGAKNRLAVVWRFFGGKSDPSFLFKNNPVLFVDSGAYSVYTRGVAIDIDKYIAFLHRWKNEIIYYAGLDVIGDYKSSAKNQAYMESCGLRPIPTFHVGEPFSELKRLLGKYTHIAIGGLVGGSINAQIEFLDQCFSIITDEFKRGNYVRVHGFGITSLRILERYPFYSVDSTSWLTGGQIASIYDFSELGFKHKRVDSKHLLLCRVKADLKGLIDSDSRLNYLNRNLYNIRQFMRLEKYLTELWRKRGVEWLD